MDMRSQLSDIRPKIVKKKDNVRDPSPSPMRWEEDGVDHINIWERGKTEVGRSLSRGTVMHFRHRYFGKFNSLEAFWYYIQSAERDDRVRIMARQTLKNFARKLEMIRIVNFRAIIMDTLWQIIRQHKDAAEAIKLTTLPFDHYYINKTTRLRIRPIYFKWYVMGAEEIRKALQEDREPDFTFLLDKRPSEIYEDVLPKRPSPKPVADRDVTDTIDALEAK